MGDVEAHTTIRRDRQRITTSIVAGLVIGLFLEAGVIAVIVCGLIYAILAWFFAQRRHWAWITLTILSFNPIAWIINAIYLRKRWAEPPAATATT